jgi:hypothetical protein
MGNQRADIRENAQVGIGDARDRGVLCHGFK